MQHIFYRPGKERKEFSCYRKQSAMDEKGRVAYNESIYQGKFWGSLATITQKEYDGVSGIRKFYVQAVENPGELNIANRIYCEERYGMAKEVMASV